MAIFRFLVVYIRYSKYTFYKNITMINAIIVKFFNSNFCFEIEQKNKNKQKTV